MAYVLGIDLGTTNSVAAVFKDGAPAILESADGSRLTPSVVGFAKDGVRLVGHAARNQQVTNPEHTVYSVKRFMGRRHEEVASEEKIVPYQVVGKPHEYVQIKVGRRRLTPQELSGMILREIKERAEAQLGTTIKHAVITVPAYFNDAQRQATKDSGAIAGLEVLRIINEPTAAALAYGLRRADRKRIVVFDFGGGTFDLSILEFDRGTYKVLGVHGNTHLGGDDIDQRIIDVLADDFRRKERIDLREEPMALQRLKEAAEKAKRDLSDRIETTVHLPFVAVDGNGPRHLQHTLTREVFDGVCTDLWEDVRRTCQTLLRETGISAASIDEVVLVGGSTRIPMVQEIAKQVFDTNELDKSLNPDEVVAMGAAVLGGVLSGELRNVNLMDVTSRSLGVETVKGGMGILVEKNTGIPCSVKRVFTTPRDNQRSVPINVLEGEGVKASENRTLALFQLAGIRKAARGVPQIEVEFSIDANGILAVVATDKDTGARQQVVVEGLVGLNRAEIERMRESTRECDEANSEREQMIDMRNHAETVLHDLRKWMEYNRAGITERSQKRIYDTMHKLQKQMKRNDRPGMRTSLARLDAVMREYRQAG